MRVPIGVALAFVLLAVGGASSPAAEEVAPEGLWKSVGELPLPDLAGFPAGTIAVQVKFQWLAGGKPLQVQWVFERGSGGASLALMAMQIERLRKPDPALTFPDKYPPEDFCAGWGKLLAAGQAGDVAGMKPYVPAKGREEFAKEGKADDMRKRIAAMTEMGLPLDEFLKSGLPRVVGLPPRCNAFELVIAVPARRGDKAGAALLSVKMHVEPETLANWVLDEFDPEFKDKLPPMPEAGPGAAAPEGLKKLATGVPFPDVAGFPAGTRQVKIEAVFRIDGRILEARARWAAESEGAQPTLSDARIRQKTKLDSELAIPARPPAEGPLESVRSFAAAIKAWDPEKVWAYLPAKERARGEKDKWLEHTRAEVARHIKEDGFDSAEVLLANLPKRLLLSGEPVAVSVEWEVPGELAGKPGTFGIGFEALVDAPDAARWAVGEFDVDFSAKK